MSIGRFSRLTGLSIHTLRHYDDLGLLRPARVDESSGYRRYTADQVTTAKRIQRLRFLEMPLDEIRRVCSGEPEERRNLFVAHQQRLARRGRLIADQIHNLERELQQQENAVPATARPSRPCQLKITVSDVAAATEFYAGLLGVEPTITRRAGDDEFYGFMFGNYGDADFFLIHLLGSGEFDALGPSTFGLLVDDLDAAHKRALTLGATEAMAPISPEGMPRSSAVRDRDDNWIWLAQD